jgi:SOS-response transcriptional repressor LexA
MVALRNKSVRAAGGTRAAPVVHACAVGSHDGGHAGDASESLNDRLSRFHHESICSDSRYEGKRHVANLCTDMNEPPVLASFMKLRPENQWVESARRKAGLTQAQLNERFKAELGGNSEDRSIINKIVKGRRRVKAEEMLIISAITRVPVPTPPSQAAAIEISLWSWVAAGKAVDPETQIPPGDETFTVGDLPPGEYFALRVVGTSMDRISPEGSIIIVDRADRQLVGGHCYVFSIRGEATYKAWQPARAGVPAYLAPRSHGEEPPIFFKSQTLEVVGRVRRTFLDL